MNFFDSHSHLNFKPFAEDWKEAVDRALKENVHMINVGTNLATSKRSVEIAEEVGEGMYAAVGIHPIHLAKKITERATFDGQEYSFTTKSETFDKRKFFDLMKSEKVVAVGESGLDYYHLEDFKADDMTREEYIQLQKEILYEILGFAREVGKPHIFHCRDAYDDFVDLVKTFSDNSDGGSGPGSQVRGVVHCFTGSMEQAKKILEIGLYIGFTGIITFPNAKELQATATEVPLDRMLIETDCPFLAPQAVRGKRNEPLYVKYVAEKIAELKSISIEEVAETTYANTRELFQL